MQVTSTGARLEYDCADGTIEEPLRPDASGRFVVSGVHAPGQGGPVRAGEILPSFRARYEGQLAGPQMLLRVTLVESPLVVGVFTLQRGSPGLILRCL
jgi:hypothetical protein